MNRPNASPRLNAALLAIAVFTAGCSTGGAYVVPTPAAATPVTGNAVPGRVFFVDASLPTGPCTAYDAGTRHCGSGRDLAFKNLADAAGMAGPGDRVIIRAGIYASPLRPMQSGTRSAPVVFTAASDERAEIVVAEAPALQLTGVQHIHIQGLDIHDSLGWARLEDAHFNTIERNHFSDAIARGTTGGLKLVRSHNNRIHANLFERGNDSIVVQASDRNRIEGNTLTWARHSLLSIRCGNFNIVRGNRFHNERQKAAEIYDCEGVSDAPIRYDATKRNLWEFNNFAHVRGAWRNSDYNGIQYAASLGIVRGNLFNDNQGGALHFALYAQEAQYVYGNRVYGNRFIANRCGAISSEPGGGLRVGDNRIVGNVFADNTNCNGAADTQRDSLVYNFEANLDNAPRSAQPPDAWLAHATADGQGLTMQVDDVMAFFDGYGIDGEVGDMLRIGGVDEDIPLVKIDYANRVLVLGRAVRWAAGAGVRVVLRSGATAG
ncbi:MAG: right-handed parallel beta-helix repeat-containing protein [Pseudomonadales bacterium]|nr:right-handed parallel beta-helix repeat-containing protein [Pseudomonadales bacterium]